MIYRILPLIAVAGAIALFALYIHPTVTGPVAATSTEIKTIDRALAAAERFESKQSELARQKAAIPPEQLARLTSYMPDGVDNVQLILDLNALAARSGLTLSDFTVGDEGATTGTAPASSAVAGMPEVSSLSGGAPTESLNLSLKATGTYASLRTFLDGVETSLRPLDLVDLSVSDSATGVYTYQMTFQLYWLR